MDSSVATAALQNFWFNGAAHRIEKLGILNDVPYAKVEPSNPELEKKLKKQMLEDQNISYTTKRGYALFFDDVGAFEEWEAEQEEG